RRTDRAQVAGARGRTVGRRRAGGLLARGFLAGRFLARGLLAGRFLARGFLAGRFLGRLLLRGQVARGLFLGLALLFLALALELLAAFGFLLGGELFLLRAALGFGLGAGDGGLQALDRRVGRIGLLDQGQQAAGLVEIAAIAALRGRDHRHRQQVDQRAGHAGVGRLLVAQGQVVLHRVVPTGGVQPAFLVCLGRGLAQLLGAERGHFGRDRFGRRLLRGRRRCRGRRGGLLRRLVLSARGQQAGQAQCERGAGQQPTRPPPAARGGVGGHRFSPVETVPVYV